MRKFADFLVFLLTVYGISLAPLMMIMHWGSSTGNEGDSAAKYADRTWRTAKMTLAILIEPSLKAMELHGAESSNLIGSATTPQGKEVISNVAGAR